MRLVNYTLQDAKIRGHSVLLAQNKVIDCLQYLYY